MKVEEFLKRPGSWLVPAEDNSIAISSRIRLARNFREFPFPDWAGEEKCVRIWEELKSIFKDMKSFPDPLVTGMGTLKKLDKKILFERHLISREHENKGKGSGLVVRFDESIAIMINEEDHLRIQALRPGLDLKSAWRSIDAVDTELEQKIRYAFSPSLGYLTACPSNVGTGMRASVMVHIPGLVLMDEVNPIIKGMGKIGIAVRGLWGEGTEASGNMFQVSNQITLGDKEEDMIAHLKQIILELIEHERNARSRLMEKKPMMVQDHVGRAYGILTHAHVLSSQETLNLLSSLRLGVDMGILKTVDLSVINELLILTQPGHLQKLEGRRLKADERDQVRAQLVRMKLLNGK
ncbi:MAG: protein arginine kinase [Kiritimatiellae bacterium]|nr:protein arginine kinase [Kiritimatiellia bacterium]